MRIAKSFLRAFTGLTLLLAVGCGEEGPTLLDDVQPQFGVSSDVLGQVGGPLLPTHTVPSHGSHLGPGSFDVTPASSG